MEQTILLLYAKPYHITEDGQTNEGISFSYLTTDSLAPTTGERGLIGIQPVKGSLPLDKSAMFVKAPAFYNAQFTLAASGGRNVLKVSSLEYLSDVDGVK